MTAQKVLFNSDAEEQIDSIKKAATGGMMRKIYTPVFDDKGKMTQSAYDAAVAAFKKGEAAAADAIPCLAHDDSNWRVLNDKGEPTKEFDPSINAAVAVVGTRQRRAGSTKMESGIKALVLFPMPSHEAFVEEADTWVRKVIEKESAHVAFRGLRNAESAEELASAFERMPRDVDAYVTEYARSGEGLDTDAFDALWNPFRKRLKEKMPALVELLPTKGEVLKCIRSKSFAESQEETAKLEEAGIFEYIADSLIAGGADWKDADGNPAPLDTSAIQEWKDGRESLNLAPPKTKEKDFSVLSDLSALMGGDEEEDEDDE